MLRRLREAKQFSLDDAARELDIGRATIQRYETERGSVRVAYVKAMLDAYGVAGAFREELLDIARNSRMKGWWTAYEDVLPADFESYVGLEAEAVSLRAYDTHLVHGLLQTDGYASALISAGRPGDSVENIDRLVALRMRRQALLDRKPRFTLRVIMDEAVLRRPIGGPALMRDQLRHLCEAVDRPNVTLQVMPYARGAHSGLSGAFSILEFRHELDPEVVYVDSPAGNIYVEDERHVARFILEFTQMRGEALPPNESIDLVSAAVRDL